MLEAAEDGRVLLGSSVTVRELVLAVSPSRGVDVATGSRPPSQSEEQWHKNIIVTNAVIEVIIDLPLPTLGIGCSRMELESLRNSSLELGLRDTNNLMVLVFAQVCSVDTALHVNNTVQYTNKCEHNKHTIDWRLPLNLCHWLP